MVRARERDDQDDDERHEAGERPQSPAAEARAGVVRLRPWSRQLGRGRGLAPGRGSSSKSQFQGGLMGGC